MKRPIYLFSTSSHPKAINVNSLHVSFLKPDIDFSKYDYLIITSKQSVNSLKQYNSDEYITKKSLCVSHQSAKAFEDIGGHILDIGDGYGDDLINKIKEYPKETKWLYIRAKEVASNFSEICKDNGYHIDEKIVYESSCSEDVLNVDIDNGAVLIFTSPSTLKCFLKNHTIEESSIVVVIGKTTSMSVPEGVKVFISEKNSIESCIELALTF